MNSEESSVKKATFCADLSSSPTQHWCRSPRPDSTTGPILPPSCPPTALAQSPKALLTLKLTDAIATELQERALHKAEGFG